MQKIYRIELDDFDLGQLLDGLEVRAEAWEKTAEYHRAGKSLADFVVEECSDADEADRIAAHYRSIIKTIENQRKTQL
ncbi:MAG: hypothetical protein ACTHKU_13210 [Verrucomicrobiota bacterium]